MDGATVCVLTLTIYNTELPVPTLRMESSSLGCVGDDGSWGVGFLSEAVRDNMSRRSVPVRVSLTLMFCCLVPVHEAELLEANEAWNRPTGIVRKYA